MPDQLDRVGAPGRIPDPHHSIEARSLNAGGAVTGGAGRSIQHPLFQVQPPEQLRSGADLPRLCVPVAVGAADEPASLLLVGLALVDLHVRPPGPGLTLF
jgi:hypothetical protein